jgi:DNA polymerase III delta prime subunit
MKIKTQLIIFVMYLEAKETARLYQLLSNKLGSDTAEAMFKYIDNKTERSVEATIKTLATKDDLANVRKEASENKADIIKWMFVFWVGQLGAMLAIMLLFLKK